MNRCPYTGKEAFVTAGKAYAERDRRDKPKRRDHQDAKFWHGPLSVYRCIGCGGYHLGHSNVHFPEGRRRAAFKSDTGSCARPVHQARG